LHDAIVDDNHRLDVDNFMVSVVDVKDGDFLSDGVYLVSASAVVLRLIWHQENSVALDILPVK
jgi:hypothetical protein